MSLEERIKCAVERRHKLLAMRSRTDEQLGAERAAAAQWAYNGGCELTRQVGCRHLDVVEQVLTERGLV